MSSKNVSSDTPTDTDLLSQDERAVLAEYLVNGMNATRAWMRTHLKASYGSAAVSGHEWLKKPKIQAELTRIFNEKAMSAEEALARLADIARGTHYHFIEVDNDGFVWFNFADPEAKEYLHLIKKIKTKRERRIDGTGDDAQEWEGEWVEVELYDAQAAQRDILKMHGKFVEKVDVTSGGEKIANLPANTEQRLADIYAMLKERAEAGKDAE